MEPVNPQPLCCVLLIPAIAGIWWAGRGLAAATKWPDLRNSFHELIPANLALGRPVSSDTFDEKLMNGKTKLSKKMVEERSWQLLAVEATGIVNKFMTVFSPAYGETTIRLGLRVSL